MLKHLLTGSSAFILLLAANVSAQAQTPQQPEPQPQVQESPLSPSTQQSPGGQSGSQVSSEELQKFAKSVKQLQVIEREADQEMIQAVQRRGLSGERFVEIYQAQQNPQAKPGKEVTSQERQQFEQAVKQVGDIQQKTELKMQQAIQSEGLEPVRFRQILAVVQRDPDLQRRVQQLL